VAGARPTRAPFGSWQWIGVLLVLSLAIAYALPAAAGGQVALGSATGTASATADVHINFQPAAAPVPSAYVVDSGAPYSSTTGYGWVTQASLSSATHTPLDLTLNPRDRNVESDQRLDTLIHMQYPANANGSAVKTPGAWEYTLANGTYAVTVAVGDPVAGIDPESYVIHAEGVTLINNFVPSGANGSATRHSVATATITVADGRLTIDAIGGTNTKLDYMDIVPSSGPDTTPPAAPANVTATPGDTRVQLAWTPNSETDLAGYNVYRGTSTPVATTTPINGTSPLPSASFLDTGVTNGSTYFYVVSALDTSGNSATSATVSANPTASTTSFAVNVNFQDDQTTPPAGYVRDFGQPYGARTDADEGNGLTYGWVTPGTTAPLSLVGNGRNRNNPPYSLGDADVRRATFVHMQYTGVSGVAAPGTWEIAVPNGSYTVAVGVGDGSFADSVHQINIEGQSAIAGFQPSTSNLFASATRTVTVADGRLTIDAQGGTNTKVDYAVIQSSTTNAASPAVSSVSPSNGATGVFRDAAVTAEVTLPNLGAGIDETSLNSTTVRLTRMSDNTQVAAHVNTSGGGDVIVLQPSVVLDANARYEFDVTSGLKDVTGAAFAPFTSTFTTGSAVSSGGAATGAAFSQTVLSTATGKSFTSVLVGPDHKLYAATLNGEIDRFGINADGTLGTAQVINSIITANGGARTIIGLAFDPSATATNLVLWVSHSFFWDGTTTGPDWSGKITRLSGTDLTTVQDYVVNLPRSIRDHETNSIAFGPDGALYVSQGSDSTMGAPDSAWGNRPEHLLSAAILRVDPALVTTPPLDAKTESGGTYDPFATGAPLTIYASGVRNAYDLVWHRNGQLYAPTNGSAAGGNTPATPSPLPPACQSRLDSATNGTYAGPQVPALANVATAQDDYLFRIVNGGYYGHPDPARCEWVLNGGNPTSAADPSQVAQYPVGTQPDRNWRGAAAYDFGLHYSPDGAIEYKGNAFGGALDGKLLVTRYSAGDDIIALTPGGSNLDIVSVDAAIPGFSGFVDPLDLAEDPSTGNLYVTELGAQRITLLKPMIAGTTAQINFQPASAPVPSGYTVDSGSPYSAARGFGWVTQASLSSATHTPLDLTPNTRDRNIESDQRTDTLIHMQYPSNGSTGNVATPGAWEYNLPNGTYSVTAALGDPLGGAEAENYTLHVEGVTAVSNFVPSGGNGAASRHTTATVTVTVTDGRLTIDAIGGVNTKLDYVLVSPSSGTPSNGRVTLQNLDGIPSNNRLVFSRIGTLASPPSTYEHDRATLRIKNTGTGPLQLTGLPIAGPWRLAASVALPMTIAAGGQLDVTLIFTAESGSVWSGSLTVQSDDPSAGGIPVQLAGWWQTVPEGGVEPSLAQIVNGVFGYRTTITAAGQQLNQAGFVSAVGDEVLSPYWRRADTTKPVGVTQIVAFHGQGNPATVYWYPKNTTSRTPILTVPGTDAQTVLPRLSGNSTGIATASFNPTSTSFGFNVDAAEWSDPTLNNQTPDRSGGCPGPCGQHVRFWPVKDSSGATVPNTWLMAMDYAGINYDYNDNLYLISNMSPDPDGQTYYRLDVGGSSTYTDALGRAWTPDTGLFQPSTAIAESGDIAAAVTNTNDPTVYGTYRGNVGNVTVDQRVLTYTLPVSGATKVNVRLHFAERFSVDATVGKRVFQIAVNGTTISSSFDIVKNAGAANRALVIPLYHVPVVNGAVIIKFSAVVDYPSIAGIEVVNDP
jgi:hypothetical protein